MTNEVTKKYAEKLARIQTATALKEPDRVPVIEGGAIYAAVQAGYTVAECIYDETLQKTKDASIKFQQKYDPDTACGIIDFAGEGRAMDLLGIKYFQWAGRPGTKIDPNSIQQFLEYPVLLDDEFERFYTDRTGWEMNCSMPRLSTLAEPMAKMKMPLSHHGGLKDLAAAFSAPDTREMIRKLWEVHDFFTEMAPRKAQVMKEISVDQGFPSMIAGKVCVAFDEYSDCLRGTLLSLSDLYEYPEEIERWIAEYHPTQLEYLRNLNKDHSKDGKWVMMTLHKGLDGFMSDEHYVKYYWRYLQEIIETIVDIGMVPYVFCEGRYSSRLKHIREVPKGKVIYKFEDTPIELLKKEVGDVACITGAFNNWMVDFGTPQQVEDEVKRILDIAMPGGGFMFQTNASLCSAKPENVDAMFNTLAKYGKY